MKMKRDKNVNALFSWPRGSIPLRLSFLSGVKLIIACARRGSKGSGVCLLEFQSCLCQKVLSKQPLRHSSVSGVPLANSEG